MRLLFANVIFAPDTEKIRRSRRRKCVPPTLTSSWCPDGSDASWTIGNRVGCAISRRPSSSVRRIGRHPTRTNGSTPSSTRLRPRRGVGVIAVVHAALKLPKGAVAGAFLVSAADIDNAQRWPVTQGDMWPDEGFGFTPIPLQALPFPAVLISSSGDPYCQQPRARHFAAAWCCDFVDVELAGHITTASGFGPWPDGLLRFGTFLAQLGP